MDSFSVLNGIYSVGHIESVFYVAYFLYYMATF